MVKTYKVYFLLNENEKIVYVGSTERSLAERFSKGYCFDKRRLRIVLHKEFLKPEDAEKEEIEMIKFHKTCLCGFNKIDYPNNCKKTHKNGFSGKTHSTKVREKIGTRSLGNDYAKGNSSRTGMKNSIEHNQAISLHSSKPVMCIETGIVYKNARHAAAELGLHFSKISLVCNGKRKKTGNLRFKFIGHVKPL